MSRHSLPAADAAWLHMDRPTNPMVVNSLVLQSEPPNPERATRILQERLIDPFPRFRQRVADPLGRGPAFEDDPSFDIENHLHRIALPSPGDKAALQRVVSDLVSQPLDHGRPLWHAYTIEGGERGAATLWRIHHCIADGIALAQVLLATTDEGGGSVAPNGSSGDGRSTLRRLIDLPRRAASAALGLGSTAVHEGMEVLARPDHLRQLGQTALRDASTTAKLIGSPADAPSHLRASLTGTRRVAWSEPFPLIRVKDAAARLRVTINDILVTALAASLHELLGSNGVPDEIHAMVPFNLRPLDEPVPSDLGNDFALILLTLPVGDLRPAERLRQVSSRMNEIKNSHEATISYGIVSAIGLTPPLVEDRLIGFFSDKASLVVTNVPGPRQQLHFAGVPIESVLVWAPCSGSLGMTVSIYSYAGEVTTGFMTDTAVVSDPDALARAYARELERLISPAPTA
jgi:diacylglycerol O-acyltransferase / wax synthase